MREMLGVTGAIVGAWRATVACCRTAAQRRDARAHGRPRRPRRRGGPIAALREGDTIIFDVPNRRLDLDVSDAELRAHWALVRRRRTTPRASSRSTPRWSARPPKEPRPRSPALWRHHEPGQAYRRGPGAVVSKDKAGQAPARPDAAGWAGAGARSPTIPGPHRADRCRRRARGRRLRAPPALAAARADPGHLGRRARPVHPGPAYRPSP